MSRRLTCSCAAAASAAAAVVVPAGYYLKTPGQVAPCPTDEFKSGVSANGSCTACPKGATTPKEGATSEAECNSKLQVDGMSDEWLAVKIQPGLADVLRVGHRRRSAVPGAQRQPAVLLFALRQQLPRRDHWHCRRVFCFFHSQAAACALLLTAAVTISL